MTGGQLAGMGAWAFGLGIGLAAVITASTPSHAQRDMQSCEAMCGASEYVESFRYELPAGAFLHIGDGAPVCTCVPNCREDATSIDGGVK